MPDKENGWKWLTLDPHKMRHVGGHCYAYAIPKEFFPPDSSGMQPSGTLLENEQILGPEALYSGIIQRFGGGYFSIRRDPKTQAVSLHFSASDNSIPVFNGRTYTLSNRSIGFAKNWDRLKERGWLNHSRGRYFLSRGGDRVPPPILANLSVTNICNLRCSICGSQNMLEPVNRRHMDFRVFTMVADALFPLLSVIEFNSRGEPLLHPRIGDMLEIVREYDLFFRLQTNGTQFRSKTIEVLTQMTGEISISVDATCELFEYARCGAKWAHVDEGVKNLLKERDDRRLAVTIYPTLTATTITGAKDLVLWAMERGIDRIDFHRYEPIAFGKEECPTEQQVDELKSFIQGLDSNHPIEIRVDYKTVKAGNQPILPYLVEMKYPNMPMPDSSPQGHPVYTCMAPVQSVDIDLDGGVCVCCRTQSHRMGNALTVEAFADCWFGHAYQALRESLKRPSLLPTYPTCRDCIKR